MVDLSGRPVDGVEVEQSWRHYTLETNFFFIFLEFLQRETKTTDREGIVSFDQRVIWANRLWERAGEIFNRLLVGIHASYGPSASVFAQKGCALGHLIYTPRSGLENTLVLDIRMNTPECR